MNAIKLSVFLFIAVAAAIITFVMSVGVNAFHISTFRHGYSLNGGAITISNVDFSESGAPIVKTGKYQTENGGAIIDISCPIGDYVREQIRTIKSKLNDSVCDEDFGLISNASGLARQFAKENGLIYRGSCK